MSPINLHFLIVLISYLPTKDVHYSEMSALSLAMCHMFVTCRLYDRELEVVQVSYGHTDSIQSVVHVQELNLVSIRTTIYIVLQYCGCKAEWTAKVYCWLYSQCDNRLLPIQLTLVWGYTGT